VDARFMAKELSLWNQYDRWHAQGKFLDRNNPRDEPADMQGPSCKVPLSMFSSDQ